MVLAYFHLSVLFGLCLCCTSFIPRLSIHYSTNKFHSSPIFGGRNDGNSYGGEGKGTKRRQNSKPSNKSSPNAPSGNSKNVRLDQRKGSRPLTAVERKAKEMFEGSKLPEVERVHVGSRMPLADLIVGQKMRGRIIAVKEFGMFVDVGSKKDGLVHIKDVSKDYFIQDLQSRYSPGQDVDVWIKFADGDKWKLGLQMFPVDQRLSAPAALPNGDGFDLTPRNVLTDYQPEEPVIGTVVRVSNFGVFVDIGCDVDAFLHRRKMKIGRRRRQERPWELHPVGAKVKGFIHEIDTRQRRISLTTYDPTDWDAMLPAPQRSEDDDIQGLMSPDDEEFGGSTRAANLRALERTLALSLDDDVDDDEEDDEDDEDADEDREYLINSASGIDRAQVLIDDFGSPGPLNKATKSKQTNSEEEISVDDLFDELSVGKEFVTLPDIMTWEYLQELIAEGEIDDDEISELFKQAGSKNGKLIETDFPSFIDLLADSLGLEELDGDLDLEAEGDELDEDAEERLLIDDGDGDAKISMLTSNDEDDEDINMITSDDEIEDEQELLGLKKVTEKKGLAALAETKLTSNDLMKYMFDGVAGKKGKVTLEDVLAWDFAQSLVADKTMSTDDVRIIYHSCLIGQDKALDRNGFEKLVDGLSTFDSKYAKTSEPSKTSGTISMVKSSTEMANGKLPVIPTPLEIGDINMMSSDEYAAAKKMMMDDDYDEESKTVYDEEEVRELFESLRDDEAIIRLETALTWEPIIELIEAGVFDRSEFNDIFEEAGGSKEDGIDLIGFNNLLELLAPFIEGDDEVDGSSELVVPVLNDFDETAQVDVIDEDEQDDEEVLKNVFSSLAHGKTRVSLNDMLNWDIVLELMGESLLTEQSLQEKMSLCGGDKKGVDIIGFDKLVDMLVGMYADSESLTNADKETDIVSNGIIKENDFVITDIVDGEGNVEDTIYNVDTTLAFEEVAKGKEFVTLGDISDWYLIQEMTSAGLINSIEVRRLLENAGVTCDLDGTEKINIMLFEAFLDELSDMTASDEEEEDDEGDNDAIIE